jgi:hypothetical protein
MRTEMGTKVVSGIVYLLSSFLDWGALLLLFRYIVTRKDKYLSFFIVLFSNKIPYIGRLPGDIIIKRENFVFYFPF